MSLTVWGNNSVFRRFEPESHSENPKLPVLGLRERMGGFGELSAKNPVVGGGEILSRKKGLTIGRTTGNLK